MSDLTTQKTNLLVYKKVKKEDSKEEKIETKN